MPMAVAVLPKDLMHRPRTLVERHADLRQWTVLSTGGNFAAAEEPGPLVEDIRSFVRHLRKGY